MVVAYMAVFGRGDGVSVVFVVGVGVGFLRYLVTSIKCNMVYKGPGAWWSAVCWR